MADINGIVTLGALETPGEATVLLLDATLENVVDSTTSDPVTGEYSFTGLAAATVFFAMVLGDGVYLSRCYGPITTDASSGDPDFASVVLLLHGDDVDGSTTIIDVKGKTVTASGDARIRTDFPLFGIGALYCAGNPGDHFSVPASGDFNFGTGDFCVEVAARFDAHTTTCTLIGNYLNSGAGWALQYRTDTGGLRFGYGDTSLIDRAWTPTDGVYYRICISRAGTDLRLFVDGAQLGATASNSTNLASGDDLSIGRLNFGGGSIQVFNGRFDEIRVTKGVARRTADYTPDATPFPNTL